jgi:hypothetical protein
MKRQALAFLAVLTAGDALAGPVIGRNPGDWKMSTMSLEVGDAVEDGRQALELRLRNRDAFRKSCALQIELAGRVVLTRPLLLAAERDYQYGFGIPTEEPLDADDLALELACVKLEEDEAPEDAPKPEEAACLADGTCENLCKAADAALARCQNDHLVLTYRRGSHQVQEKDDYYLITVPVHNDTPKPLTCAVALTTRVEREDDPSDYAALNAFEKAHEIGANGTVAFRVRIDRKELGDGYVLNAARPRVTAVCGVAVEACDPTRRDECNWIRTVN